jgi:hypothetical protein
MSSKLMPLISTVTVLLCLSTAVGLAVEIPETSSFLRTELAITGVSPSSLWHGSGASAGLVLDQIGGEGTQQPDEFGGGLETEKPEEEDSDSVDLGVKVKAGLFSAILPGAGQFYNGDKKKAYIMGGAEVAIWTAYFVFDTQGDNRMNSAEEYAGIYAGTIGEHANSYWQNVGRHMDSDEYNDARMREARALQETPSGLVYGDDTWQWVNDTRRSDFTLMRADANSAYDRRDFMILFAVVNRAISVVDAVIGAGGNKPGTMQTEVLGMNLEVEMLPSWRNPGAQCVVSRRF